MFLCAFSSLLFFWHDLLFILFIFSFLFWLVFVVCLIFLSLIDSCLQKLGTSMIYSSLFFLVHRPVDLCIQCVCVCVCVH